MLQHKLSSSTTLVDDCSKMKIPDFRRVLLSFPNLDPLCMLYSFFFLAGFKMTLAGTGNRIDPLYLITFHVQ